MTNYDVIKKLIGPVTPIGCSSTDVERLKNLKEMADVVNKLLTDIDNVVHEYKDSHEQSVKDIVKFGEDFFNEIGIVE